MVQALALGALASFFFAVTFVLNRQMQLAGGHWLWTSSLRFAFMLPVLFAMLLPRRKYRGVLAVIARRPLPWILWSTVGFGFFYAFLCIASSYGPSWMVASTWQITIVSGILLTPLIHRRPAGGKERTRIPLAQLAVALVIFSGVILVQENPIASGISAKALISILCILVAAVSYPLGNRKMMAVVPPDMTTTGRVFGMTLCSMPFWIVLAVVALALGIQPSMGQIVQSAVVALCSGVIATMLFFRATELARHDAKSLAAVESTQAGEVVFSLLLGVLLFGDAMPDLRSLAGIAVIVAGIVLNGVITGKKAA